MHTGQVPEKVHMVGKIVSIFIYVYFTSYVNNIFEQFI